MRRTKIVATLGPASNSPEMINALIDAGVNIFRLNFSHGDHETHRKTAETIRQLSDEKSIYVGILGDLQGPKIRVGDLDQPITLAVDDEVRLTPALDSIAAPLDIPVKYKLLPQSVQSGDTLLLDDGLIRLVVKRVEGESVFCEVKTRGVLKSRKGLNKLGGGLSAPAITEKDFKDLELAVDLNLDYLAVSFPSCAADLAPVRERLLEAKIQCRIIAKLERAEAVSDDDVLLDLINASDGVMVARGDLGVEVGDAQLLGYQKRIIRLARRNNKPVITATQMMESMINNPIPTRAEVFDVANAVLDGTDAVMLSGETAAGQYPVETVKAMAETCVGAERHPDSRRSGYRLDRKFDRIDETIAMSAMYAAHQINDIRALVCMTESGSSALFMSRISSGLPIFGISRHHSSCQRMAMYRGVYPLHADVTDNDYDSEYHAAMAIVEKTGLLNDGDRIVCTCGDISGEGGQTNMLKILEYKTSRN